MTAARRLRRRSERAAALPEYALLIALIAVVAIGALDALQSSASATFRDTASELGAGPEPAAAPSSPTPSGTGPTPAAPPSTAAPTTTPPTTAAPTTAPPTTAPPTTAAPRATTATATFGTATASRDGNEWTATVALTVTDDRGRPVRDAEVTVRVEYRIGSGSWREADEVDGETDGAGVLSLRTADLERTGRNAVGSLRYTVVDLDADGLSWAGGSTSVTISAP
jgi:Flp pilus assembly pilin Flp